MRRPEVCFHHVRSRNRNHFAPTKGAASVKSGGAGSPLEQLPREWGVRATCSCNRRPHAWWLYTRRPQVSQSWRSEVHSEAPGAEVKVRPGLHPVQKLRPWPAPFVQAPAVLGLRPLPLRSEPIPLASAPVIMSALTDS